MAMISGRKMLTENLDRGERYSSGTLVLLLAVVIIGAVVVSLYLDEETRSQFIVWFLAFFAGVGVLGLFAFAIGGVQLAGRERSDDLTRVLMDGQSDAVLVTDADGRPRYANAAYLALSGSREVVTARTVERLFSGGAEVSEAIYRLAQAARERRAHQEELRLVPALDGSGPAAWYRIKVRPIDRDGSRETAWTVADVTRDRERHENVFQELQNAIDYLDHAPAGFFSADRNGEVVYMNATLAGWLDHDIAEVGSGGLRLRDLAAGDAVALIETVAGVAGEVKSETLDVDFRKRGGQALPVRLIHSVSYGHDGTPGPSRTLVLNRLDGSGAMGAAEKAEVRFARFFHNTPLAIATVDEDGGITGNNATFARTFADVLKGAEGTSRALPEMIQDKDRAVVRRALADAARNRGDIAPVDVALVEPSQRSARLFVTPAGVARDGVAQDGSGAEGARREAAIVYLLETTEQRALQEQFAQSQKMQAVGQLAGGVAHDFNNVLTAIIGYSDLLLAQHRPTDPSFQDIMQIKQNANRAASLVKQLLAFSRRQTMRPQVVQLNDAVSDLMILVKRLVAEKVELDVRYGRDLWPVKADVNQLEQVIVNLAVNARDAMPNGGKLMLRTLNVPQVRCADFNHKLLPPADYVALEVEDTGTGMPPDVMEKIFEPFFTTKEVGKGTGLGLSMVYGIVKQTGGFVFVDSTVGKGTTFRVFLPRHVAEAGEAVEEMPEAAKPPEKDLTGQGTILLVEDEDAVRAFGSRALRSRGYTVLEATTGLEALEVIETGAHRIELIVSDVVMPEMDGPTLLLELKKRGLAHKFVFASGYAEDAFKKSMPDDEEFGFLPKPYTLKQLVEVVKEATGR